MGYRIAVRVRIGYAAVTRVKISYAEG